MSHSEAHLPSPEIASDRSDRAVSEMVPKRDFPRTVNWGNPRVEAILEAAAHCFSERGFVATTLSDIGKELGLRKSIVHYYFTNKQSLIHEVQSFASRRSLQEVQAALATSTLDATPGSGSRLTRGLRNLFVSAREKGGMRGLNLELWSAGRHDEEVARRLEEMDEQARALLRAHVDSADFSAAEADAFATLIIAVFDGLDVREEREGSSERVGAAFEAFLRMIDKSTPPCS